MEAYFDMPGISIELNSKDRDDLKSSGKLELVLENGAQLIFNSFHN